MTPLLQQTNDAHSASWPETLVFPVVDFSRGAFTLGLTFVIALGCRHALHCRL